MNRAAWRSGMRICLLSVAWVMKQAAPMAARQKAVSSGLTPAARTVFGDQADDRPGKDGQQDQDQAVAAGGRGDGRRQGRGHECHSSVRWSHEKNAVSVHSVWKNGQARSLPRSVRVLPVALACRAGREGARRQFCQLAGGAALDREGLPKPGQEGMDAFQNGVRSLLVRHMRGTAGQPSRKSARTGSAPVRPAGGATVRPSA